MVNDLTTSANNFLTELLALYALAFVIAVVVLGLSIYNLIRPIFGAPQRITPAAACTCGTATDNCTCQAGHRVEWDILAAVLSLAALELVRSGVIRRLAPGIHLLESCVYVVALTAFNITAMHASLRAEHFVKPVVADLLEDKKQHQFMMSTEV